MKSANPLVVIWGQAAAGNDAMQVKMMLQPLFPCRPLALRAVTGPEGTPAGPIAGSVYWQWSHHSTMPPNA